MTKKERIMKALKECASRMFPEGEGKVYLYGSRADGTARPDSDWDLLVVADEKSDLEDGFEKYAFPYAEIGWKFGVQITPILFSATDWEKEANTAFYNNVVDNHIVL